LLNRGIRNEGTREKTTTASRRKQHSKLDEIAATQYSTKVNPIRKPRRNNLGVPLHGASGKNNPKGRTFRENKDFVWFSGGHGAGLV
jgi:hypothetical protein